MERHGDGHPGRHEQYHDEAREDERKDKGDVHLARASSMVRMRGYREAVMSIVRTAGGSVEVYSRCC